MLLTFGLALVLEGLMGVIWGNTSHSVRPAYVNESFSIGEIFLPKAQVYGCAVARGRAGALYLRAHPHLAGPGDPRERGEPAGRRARRRERRAVAALTFAVGVASAGAGGSIVSVLYPFLPGSHYQWIARLLGDHRARRHGLAAGGGGRRAAARRGRDDDGHLHRARVGDAVPYVLIIGMLLLRPQGLLGSKLREDVATA